MDLRKDNSTFWDELYGTSLATRIGATDSSVGSLTKHDN